MKNLFFVEVREDWDCNTSDPHSIEWHGPMSYEDAEAKATEETAVPTTDHGLSRWATIYPATEGDDGEPIPDLDNPGGEYSAESAPLPDNAVLVFFYHRGKGMNYCYEVTEVRDAFREKRYSHLPYQRDSQNAQWCEVFDDPDDLKSSFEDRSCRPFNKLQSGAGRVREYLLECGYPEYQPETEEETV